MSNRPERVQHEPNASSVGELRYIEDNVVGSGICGIRVKMVAHESSPLAVDFFQLTGGTPCIANPHLFLKPFNPLLEWRDEANF